MPLVIKGDWDKPEISPDIENALKDADSLAGTAKLFGKSVEKFTDGKIKADDFGSAIDSLFGKKKKKKKHDQEPAKSSPNSRRSAPDLEHDQEKWIPVFRPIARKQKNLERVRMKMQCVDLN